MLLDRILSRKFFEAPDDGKGGSDPKADPTPTDGTGKEKVLFSPEQQAKIDDLINAAFAKGAKKAAKQTETEKLSESELLEKERAELKRQRSILEASALLNKEGFFIADDKDKHNDLLAEMLASDEAEAAVKKVAAFKKLIETKVNAEVDNRLRTAKNQPPRAGSGNTTLGDTINNALRGIKK
jgi:hypothetical protein